MGWIRSAALYLGLAVFANTATAGDLAELREGDMRKLVLHDTPVAVAAVPFEAFDGSEMTLESYKGQFVVLNFWATWCAPCRKEMPTLSGLQAELGGENMTVVTVATGRNQPQAMQAFFDDIGVDNLPLHRDPRQTLARNMGVLGLPITVILNPDGQEIARLQGDADWNSDNARAILSAMIAGHS